MDIPAVFSVPRAAELIHGGEAVFVDGKNAEVIFGNEAGKYGFAKIQGSKNIIREENRENFTLPEGVRVFANISSAAEAEEAARSNADGVGLFRTEFLFMSRIPGEDEQFLEYSSAAKSLGQKKLVIRTVDAGGDKQLCGFFGSKRGLAAALCNKEVFKSQIRAVLRAASFGNVNILLPFVTSPGEVKAAKELIRECSIELKESGCCFKIPPIGVMIETPQAVTAASLLADEADFLSLGTNDLAALITGIKRDGANPAAAFDLRVCRAIEKTAEVAKAKNKPLSICGEAAGNEKMLKYLLSLGINEFSVSLPLVEKTRNEIFKSCFVI